MYIKTLHISNGYFRKHTISITKRKDLAHLLLFIVQKHQITIFGKENTDLINTKANGQVYLIWKINNLLDIAVYVLFCP